MISFVIGAILVVLMIFVWIYFFSPKRKARIEQPKYDMLEDTEREEPKDRNESPK